MIATDRHRRLGRSGSALSTLVKDLRWENLGPKMVSLNWWVPNGHRMVIGTTSTTIYRQTHCKRALPWRASDPMAEMEPVPSWPRNHGTTHKNHLILQQSKSPRLGFRSNQPVFIRMFLEILVLNSWMFSVTLILNSN